MTKSAAKEQEKSREFVHLTPAVAKLRSVVERVIGRMKTMQMVAQGSHFLRDSEVARKVVKFVAALVNWMLEAKNIEQV